MRQEYLLRTSAGKFDPKLLEVNLAVIELHQQPGRYYHNVAHVCEVLQTLKELNRLTPATRAAAWFHDAIYLPGAADNEAKSAELLEKALKRHLDEGHLANARQMILATARHDREENSSPELQAFLDADLAILASAPAEYLFYSMAIRKEFSAFADDVYRTGRKRILESFLARERIFSALAPALWERKARENLTRELEFLRKAEDETPGKRPG